jgi:hypothetical protein
VKLGNETATLDSFPGGDAHMTLRARAHRQTAELIFLSSETVTIHDGAISLGGLVLEPNSRPDEIARNRRASESEVRVIWRKPEVVLEATFDIG